MLYRLHPEMNVLNGNVRSTELGVGTVFVNICLTNLEHYLYRKMKPNAILYVTLITLGIFTIKIYQEQRRQSKGPFLLLQSWLLLYSTIYII